MVFQTLLKILDRVFLIKRKQMQCNNCIATHILSVSCEVSKLHHLVAKLAENLHKLLEGADSFQFVKCYKNLKEAK